MQFEPIHIDRSNYYSIGIDRETGQHLIQVVITWVAWYSNYFRLTPDEVAAFDLDNNALTTLSYELAADKGADKLSDRLVLNEGPQRR
jgi:hypothetical protein